MKTYTSTNVIQLNAADRKMVSALMNEVLEAARDWNGFEPFYFEYKNIMIMFAPDTHFFFDIPEAPLPSLGGDVPGDLILAGQSAANDRLPPPLTEDSLPSSF